MAATQETTKSGITSVKLGNRKHVLAQIAEHKKRTVHSLVVEAVDAYIEQTQARMEYEAQAIRSFENYQQTGLHVTHDELQAWADSLNSDNPLEAPQCHK
jgi:predicted transcriptional regulator